MKIINNRFAVIPIVAFLLFPLVVTAEDGVSSVPETAVPNSALQEIAVQKIAKIEVKGLVNVKEKEIRKKITTKPGDIYSSENLKTDMNAVLDLEKFEDVTVEIDTSSYGSAITAVFAVKEKPYLLKVYFKGNKKLSKGKLKDAIFAKEKEFLDKNSIEADIKKMSDLYDENGYVDTQIDYDLSVNKITNYANLAFLITEGRKVTVEKVEVSGTIRYKPKKIAGLMETRKKKIFKTKILEDDIRKIYEFYHNNGFESVEISSPDISYNDVKTKTTVKFSVFEGPKYKLSKISFSGNSVYPDKTLFKALEIRTKQVYSKENIGLTQMAISELYGDKGYLQAEIVPELTKYPESALMDINFSITEHNIIYLGKIWIDGLANTKEYVIRREVLLKENDPFSGVKLRRSMEKIYNLGFIDDVKVDIQNTTIPDTADLVLTVTEGKPGMLQAGAGYSSVDKLVWTLQVNHMNLFGRGQKLNVMWEGGDRTQNYQVGWTEPWFLRKPMSLGLSLYDITRKQYSGNDYLYTYHKTGAEIRVGPRLSDYLSLFFIYAYDSVNTYDVQSTSITASSALTGKELTSSFTSQVIYDTRDNIYDPSRGMRQSASLQVAGGPFGGDVKFVKPVLSTSWYFPTFWKFVFTANAVYKRVIPFEEDPNHPLQPLYKFYAGGADTVRGYPQNDLTPTVNGGNVSLIMNFEYKFPIVQEKKHTILQGAFFYDIGGTWNNVEDIQFAVGGNENWRNFGAWDNMMKAGVGFGIRFTTPVFPIRLDWGWPVQQKLGQMPPEFYFTIGQIF
ncbi:MAG: outer membrane protein assembly factor BamA [Elusimicrobia bacterium RIFOXYB2_FULL_48_7]|nr:MAG: outer membrane protein assembly factor BamA [Elusimicrobia bacterium RIFOXYB2_FULL_48_7]